MRLRRRPRAVYRVFDEDEFLIDLGESLDLPLGERDVPAATEASRGARWPVRVAALALLGAASAFAILITQVERSRRMPGAPGRAVPQTRSGRRVPDLVASAGARPITLRKRAARRSRARRPRGATSPSPRLLTGGHVARQVPPSIPIAAPSPVTPSVRAVEFGFER